VTAAVLDAVASAYADDPRAVAAGLRALADALDHLPDAPGTTDLGHEHAAAAADAARDHLAALLDLEASA